MAYNRNDVTAGKGDVIYGPLWWFPNGFDGEMTLDLENPATVGWVRLGEASTDGIDISQESDKTDKQVWGGKTVGTVFSNWIDKAVIRHASSTDPQLLGVLYSAENVAVDANGNIKLAVGIRTPSVGSLLIAAITDDGRKNWIYAPKAQPDINLSVTFNDTDIVVIETTYDFMADDDGKTHYQLIEGLQAPVTEPETEE